MIDGLLSIELGVYGYNHLERKTMRGGYAVPEDELGDEAALDAQSIFNGDLTAVDKALFLSVALGISAYSTAKNRNQGLVCAQCY